MSIYDSLNNREKGNTLFVSGDTSSFYFRRLYDKSSVSKIEAAKANLARSKLWLQQIKSDLEAYKSN